jgi:hypothetical protein
MAAPHALFWSVCKPLARCLCNRLATSFVGLAFEQFAMPLLFNIPAFSEYRAFAYHPHHNTSTMSIPTSISAAPSVYAEPLPASPAQDIDEESLLLPKIDGA